MPELPEVERARRVLERAARGRAIARVDVLHPALRRTLPQRDADRLRTQRIARVERRGKHQLIHLEDGSILAAHFRMSGDWEIGSSGAPLPRHTRAVVELDGGQWIALVDPRALGTLRFHPPGAPPELGLGPEPLGREFSVDSLARALAPRRGPVKPALLDQRVVAGVGNIYAVEALWVARIDPRTPAARLRRARLARLIDAVREVLTAAQRRSGRYRGNEEAERFAVYGREGEPCNRCGRSIRRVVQAGRSTYYCSRCQR